MACNVTLGGFERDCKASTGGIRQVWIANFADVKVKVKGNMVVEISPASTFREYGFKKNTGSFVTTMNRDETSGSLYYSTEIILQFMRQESEKRTEIAALSNGELVMIVKDSNNHYWYFGIEEPVTLTAGTGETGTTKADFSGYNLTFTEESTVWPYEVDPSVMVVRGNCMELKYDEKMVLYPGENKTVTTKLAVVVNRNWDVLTPVKVKEGAFIEYAGRNGSNVPVILCSEKEVGETDNKLVFTTFENENKNQFVSGTWTVTNDCYLYFNILQDYVTRSYVYIYDNESQE